MKKSLYIFLIPYLQPQNNIWYISIDSPKISYLLIIR